MNANVTIHIALHVAAAISTPVPVHLHNQDVCTALAAQRQRRWPDDLCRIVLLNRETRRGTCAFNFSGGTVVSRCNSGSWGQVGLIRLLLLWRSGGLGHECLALQHQAVGLSARTHR